MKFIRAANASSVLSIRRSSIGASVIIKPDVSPSERKRESILLKERWSLIQSGVPRKAIRIQGSRLLVRNKLHGQVSMSGSDLTFNCRNTDPVMNNDAVNSVSLEPTLKMLHEAHPGIVRMKSLAWGYVWWPGIDQQIESRVKQCTACQSSRKEPPPSPLHPWAWPAKPWSRVHIDYAGPFQGRMFLLLIDAHSKWLDIYSSTSSSTIESLRKSFATFGLPEVLVSDNAQVSSIKRVLFSTKGDSTQPVAAFRNTTHLIKPLFKSGDKGSIRNYRPISLLYLYQDS